jgi:hypothetical protein
VPIQQIGTSNATTTWSSTSCTTERVLELMGAAPTGAASYQLDLTHPVHVDEIDASCNNGSSNCNFSLAVLGNSTGN